MAGEGPDLATLADDHHQVLADLRRRGAVVWMAAVGGWVVLTREAAITVMRDAETFTVDDPRFTTAQVVGRSMLSSDGAEHRRLREPFATAFRPGEVMARDAAHIEQSARELVESLLPRGRAELRRELAGPLAVAVAAGALGLDRVAPDVLLGWYDLIVGGVDAASRGESIPSGARTGFEQLAAALHDAAASEGSLLGGLAGDLSPDELVSNAAVFLFGGIETSEGMTTNVLHHLLASPEQMDIVRRDPSLIDAAVEESLRLEPAAARVDRYATRATTVAGQAIAAGDLVVVSLAAANRDPDVFADPDRFDVRRPNARAHLAFAQGPHVCLGATLARLQARAAVAAVLELLSGVRLLTPTSAAGVVFRKPLALDVGWEAPG